MKKALKVVAAVVGALLVAACVVRGFMVWNQRRTVLPEFVDVPEGPRAPPLDVEGLRPGETTYLEAQAWATAHGLTCKDLSMRALMKEGREKVQAEMKRIEEDGGDPDTVSGASRANYYSKKERNPQIKMYCGDVPIAKQINPKYGETSDGSFTLVFDSPTHRLRYIMFDRKYQSNHLTFEQWSAANDEWRSLLGAPTKQTEAQPIEDDSDTRKTFPRMRLHKNEWRFADRRFEISATNFGPPKGIDLRMIAEVPWPLRVETLE